MRPVAYIAAQSAMILLALLPAVALVKTPNELEVLDYLLVAGCALGFLGATIPLVLSFMNSEGAEIDWVIWGGFGIGLIGLSAMLALVYVFSATG
jgi:hypothetical protein